jgi:hypothetical protein
MDPFRGSSIQLKRFYFEKNIPFFGAKDEAIQRTCCPV